MASPVYAETPPVALIASVMPLPSCSFPLPGPGDVVNLFLEQSSTDDNDRGR